MAQTEPEDATVIYLPDPSGRTLPIPIEEATAEQIAEARLGAKHRKAILLHSKKGAEARAGALPHSVTAAIAAGTVNVMLMKLINEQLVPTTAKEAADVAKVVHAIYRDAAGVGKAESLTPAERADKQAAAEALSRTLEERSRMADAALGGAAPAGQDVLLAEDDDEPIVWDHAVRAADDD